MDIVYSFARRARHYIAVFGSLLALVLATLVPGLASAAQLTERSIQLSSSSAAASGVTYEVKFTAPAATTTGAFLIDFCSNSSLVSDACTAPSGFDAGSAASTSTGVTAVSKDTAGDVNSIVATDTLTTAQAVDVVFTGIHNPTAAGVLYARIITFDTAGHAKDYVAGGDLTTGDAVDNGGVVININNTFGVSAAVQESMTFCVSSVTIPADCASTTAPNLKLGETVGSTVALEPSAVSTANMYTQISTNALSGAVINLKSSATNCGGLELAGDTVSTDCFIQPAGHTSDITTNDAAFGVKTSTATGGSDTFEPVSGSHYNSSTFVLNGDATNATGVTSTYGDPFLDTGGAPANDMNMELTFGASVSNSTPAGNYSADLSMIATGKF